MDEEMKNVTVNNEGTGHLYCYHEAWLKHGKEKQADIIWKVPALEISVDKNMCIHLDVRTFSSEKLRNKMTFKKKKFEDYPKYVFSAKKTLRRKLNSDTESSYIMRQVDGRKNEIPFLDLQSEDKFAKTKMGVLQNVIAKFNVKYAGMINLGFATKEITERIDYIKKTAKENQTRITELLKNMGINIVDQVGGEYSEMFCKNIQGLIMSKYGIHSTISRRIKKDNLNI